MIGPRPGTRRPCGSRLGRCSLACGSAGNCAAGGDLLARFSGTTRFEASIVTEVNGKWGKATVLPGVITLGHHEPSGTYVVSCPAAFRCEAVGSLGLSGQLGLPFATAER